MAVVSGRMAQSSSGTPWSAMKRVSGSSLVQRTRRM